jgi:DmsE family decaheme c-type cytochrome
MRARTCFRLASLFACATLAAAQATYVGADTCLACHEDISNAFAKNPHHALESDTKRGPEGGWKGKSCEACHGPGSAHAESLDKKDIRNPATLSPSESERICLSCHLNQTTHAGRIQSAHAKNQVACVGCHAMHKTPQELVSHKPDDVNQLCAGCHVSQWAAFNRPYKHRLPEGAMSCVDCHNPHGRNITSTVRAVAASNEPGCYKCHADKRGPFIYEHAPVRTDGCIACHEPHGSMNPRMLTRDQTRTVCLECHANIGVPSVFTGNKIGSTPPAFHDLRNPRYQTCVLCHVKVHGSNVDSSLLR